MAKRLRIAIAEDEPSIRENLKETLEELGHRVVVAARTGAELLAKCGEIKPDLVITDFRMPDMDGLEAAARLWSHMPVPIIIASAQYDGKVPEHGLDTHIFTYLAKPMSDAGVKAAVDSAMSRFREV